MVQYKITVKRNANKYFSSNSLGTDALNAILSIPNVIKAQIESEDDIQVKISYSYATNEKFWGTNEHLAKFDLERLD